jgi:hypothetical protein
MVRENDTMSAKSGKKTRRRIDVLFVKHEIAKYAVK